MTKGDIVVIGLTVILAVVLFFIPVVYRSDDKSMLKIEYNDTVRYADMYKNDVIELENNGYHLTLVIENGNTYISQSDCPDGTCRNMRGFIVCVPAAIHIEAVSGGGHEIIAG